MTTDARRVATREQLRERERLDAWVKQQLGMPPDDEEFRAYVQQRIQLTDEERHVARQLGLTDEQLRDDKARRLINEARRS